MAGQGAWDDLAVRLGSGVAMAGLGIAAIWLGGTWFLALAVLVSALMVWELARMFAPQARAVAVQLALISGVAVVLAGLLPGQFALPLLIAAALVGAGQVGRDRVLFAIYALAVILAGYGLVLLRGGGGAGVVIWLVLVVIATDVMGYFAGRMLGGPKFWPRISPKKTWSGTVAGWVSAAVVGAIAAALTPAGWGLVALSAALSLASQMGDIAESAIKRRKGVKDSSALLPGHGGLLDRFDGLLGAVLAMLVLTALGLAPEMRF
ncbi:MAG: phosphatidate cytidylyltransferase [Rhodobacteraceae bacterium]|nr:phosphatidate cytidylyltransferase [Paracoccaceae bacterium]